MKNDLTNILDFLTKQKKEFAKITSEYGKPVDGNKKPLIVIKGKHWTPQDIIDEIQNNTETGKNS